MHGASDGLGPRAGGTHGLLTGTAAELEDTGRQSKGATALAGPHDTRMSFSLTAAIDQQLETGEIDKCS